ncbi:MAG TPA: NAD-dependent epimerase/dehydratase family protein [Methanomicrobiales archaeon]|nr:NAD-dependent epimerase/dehydratase family protein [Methanomicrobiales archaeon]
MTMKFLVTGGCGFIGSHLARELTNLGEVTILDDLSSGNTGRIQDLLDRGKVKFVRGNILHRGILADACRGVDGIFHLAAIVSVSRSMETPMEVHEVNATGTLSLLSAAREAGVKKLVYSSSCAVYGDNPTIPEGEGLMPGPLSPYAASKLAGEYYCEVYRRSFGLQTASLRYFNIYGPGQDPRGEYAAVIPKFIVNVLRRRPPVIFGDGNQVRDFVSVRDVVRANILAMQRDAVGPLNIGSGTGTTVLTLAKALMDIGGLSREPVFEKARPGDIRESVADISRAGNVMGFRPKVHLADGLRETFDWFREHPG